MREFMMILWRKYARKKEQKEVLRKKMRMVHYFTYMQTIRKKINGKGTLEQRMNRQVK